MEKYTRQKLFDLARQAERSAEENEQRATDALNRGDLTDVQKYSERAEVFRHAMEDFQHRAEAMR